MNSTSLRRNSRIAPSLVLFLLMATLSACTRMPEELHAKRNYVGMTREEVLESLFPSGKRVHQVVIDFTPGGEDLSGFAARFSSVDEVRQMDAVMKANCWEINPRGEMTMTRPKVWDHLLFYNDVVIEQELSAMYDSM